jgi:hypothetical protein
MPNIIIYNLKYFHNKLPIHFLSETMMVVFITGRHDLDTAITYIEFCYKRCIILQIPLLYFSFYSNSKTESK